MRMIPLTAIRALSATVDRAARCDVVSVVVATPPR